MNHFAPAGIVEQSELGVLRGTEVQFVGADVFQSFMLKSRLLQLEQDDVCGLLM